MGIPITLAIGFLGSGKSTLINRVIADNPEKRFGARMRRLPKEIVRAKGFLDFSDPKAAGKKFVLQIVAGRPVLEAKPWSAGETRQSAMVFIGRDFDKEKLLAQLAACNE